MIAAKNDALADSGFLPIHSSRDFPINQSASAAQNPASPITIPADKYCIFAILLFK